MTAPKFDFLLGVFDIRNYNPQYYNTKIKDKIKKLYDILDVIEPLSDDEYKVLYFCVEKGNIEEYGDYEDLKVDGEVSSYEDYVERFNEDYPDDVYWYKLISSRYKNYCAISVNSKNIIYADMDGESDSFENIQLQELLDFIISKVNDCIKKLKNGTYNNYILKNYSYKNRFGVIKRNIYWEIYPESKKELLSEISQEEMNYFIKNARNTTNDRIKNMTADDYFKCVKIAYNSINFDTDNLTGKELYLRYADGRNEGLCEIDEYNSNEFDIWYNDDSKFSGHIWEIVRGHSFTRISLSVEHDDKGYYLLLNGSKILRKVEIAKIFIALNKNNIPIQIYSVDTIKSAFKGIDYIGIVPYDIIPINCGGYFNNYKPTEFIHMKDDKIFKYIEWESLEYITLK